MAKQFEYVDWVTYCGLFTIFTLSTLFDGSFPNIPFILSYLMILPLIIIYAKQTSKYRIDERNNRRTKDKRNR